MYPIVRLRRNRKAQWLRDLNAETNLSPENLVLPIFIVEGKNIREEIPTMPGVFRISIDNLVDIAKEAHLRSIKAVALFPSIDNSLKSDNADEAYNMDNLVCRAVRALKNSPTDIGVICDVALDPYTNHGHDGIVINGDVDNDKTIAALSKQALVLAKSGVDIIAPSDMMDGRIITIRRALDNEGHSNVSILSYAAKYNSSFYGPFRDAVSSNQKKYLSKATYQMDIRNSKEAIREIEQDINEGADMLMIKPAMPSLDIISLATQKFSNPIFAFQVSGEYSMIKVAVANEILQWDRAIIESVTSIKRAGAQAILTYAALEIADLIN
ncbi:MAG TPA: porphobilinogen synthase [Candidatus Megaira endosymbiont of Nemacystus decipiens]|nr:porphobilinogen synthase [Candidatus Megaera endosymbiont of Nemacystus decipiens]